VNADLNVPHNSIYSLSYFVSSTVVSSAANCCRLRPTVPVNVIKDRRSCSPPIRLVVSDSPNPRHPNAAFAKYPTTRRPLSFLFAFDCQDSVHRAMPRQAALFNASVYAEASTEVSNCTISPVSGWRMNLSKPELRSIGF
jgi:hypothetical protein